MAKGTEAKANLINRFRTAVGDDFICEKDNLMVNIFNFVIMDC